MSRGSNHLKHDLMYSNDINDITVTRSQSDSEYLEQETGLMDIPLTNVQQLFDAIMSTSIKIAEECFQQLFESVL